MDRLDILADSADGVCIVEEDQSIVLWNDSATRILGFTAREVLGRSCWSVIRGRADPDCAWCRERCGSFLAIEAGELPENLDLRVRTKFGRNVWVNVSFVVARSPTRRCRDLVHLFRIVDREHEVARVVTEFANLLAGAGDLRKDPASTDASDTKRSPDLTLREREVLRHLWAGRSTAAIARELCISTRTVRNHVTNILGKLGVHSRLEAVAYTRRIGLL